MMENGHSDHQRNPKGFINCNKRKQFFGVLILCVVTYFISSSFLESENNTIRVPLRWLHAVYKTHFRIITTTPEESAAPVLLVTSSLKRLKPDHHFSTAKTWKGSCEIYRSLQPHSQNSKVIENSVTNKSMYTIGRINPPAILIRLKGGLGNQLFQYACHYAAARKHNWPLYIYVSKSERNNSKKFGPKNREFALNQFNIPLHEWNAVDETWNVTNVHHVTDSELLNGQYPKDQVIQLNGASYCQSEYFFLYYKEEIVALFSLNRKQTECLTLLDPSSNSKEENVAVHFRRGDFSYINRTVPVNYQVAAMKEIAKMLKSPKITFYVFSDDIKYVEDKLSQLSVEADLPNGSRILFMDPNTTNSIQQFHLMSHCKHQIIPDSTFGWWAAYLNRNPNKIVIASAHQVYRTTLFGDRWNYYYWFYKNMYYPDSWIVRDPYINI